VTVKVEISQDDTPEGFILDPRDDSMRLMLIPAGKAVYGSEDGARNESPRFVAWLHAYYLGETAVTNTQYVRFLNAVQPTDSDLSAWITLDEYVGTFYASRIRRSRSSYTVEPGWEQHPVTYVSWYGAKAYCDWAGLRLPTELEWEKGARGVDGREFPWGGNGYLDGWDQARCRSRENGFNVGVSTCEVFDYDGTKPGQSDGRSPWGLYGMAGNVYEWTADWYQADAYRRYATGDLTPPDNGTERVLRGGSWSHPDYRCRAAFRIDSPLGPEFGLNDRGFRVASDH